MEQLIDEAKNGKGVQDNASKLLPFVKVLELGGGGSKLHCMGLLKYTSDTLCETHYIKLS